MMTASDNITGYKWDDAGRTCAHAYILPTVRCELASFYQTKSKDKNTRRVFDLGCGNGSTAAALEVEGYDVVGVDPSVEGITRARSTYPNIRLESGSAYEDLAARFGRFPCVVSLEVVEHVYAPRDYAHTLFDLVEPGGIAIVSTPYHGYWKNVALALTGKMDAHFTALWDHGHVKFWSIKTLSELLIEVGFERPRFVRVGRIPQLAKSMIAIARKPVA